MGLTQGEWGFGLENRGKVGGKLRKGTSMCSWDGKRMKYWSWVTHSQLNTFDSIRLAPYNTVPNHKATPPPTEQLH